MDDVVPSADLRVGGGSATDKMADTGISPDLAGINSLHQSASHGVGQETPLVKHYNGYVIVFTSNGASQTLANGVVLRGPDHSQYWHSVHSYMGGKKTPVKGGFFTTSQVESFNNDLEAFATKKASEEYSESARKAFKESFNYVKREPVIDLDHHENSSTEGGPVAIYEPDHETGDILHATLATKVPAAFIEEIGGSGHPLGVHLRQVQLGQDLKFYSDYLDPKTMYKDIMTPEGYLNNKSTWFEKHPHDEKLELYLSSGNTRLSAIMSFVHRKLKFFSKGDNTAFRSSDHKFGLHLRKAVVYDPRQNTLQVIDSFPHGESGRVKVHKFKTVDHSHFYDDDISHTVYKDWENPMASIKSWACTKNMLMALNSFFKTQPWKARQTWMPNWAFDDGWKNLPLSL